MSTFLSAKQAARYCGVSTKTVLRWIEAGRLKADKRGRAYHIAPDDVVRRGPTGRTAELQPRAVGAAAQDLGSRL
jgi:excisionase family DNA binding protein